MTRPAHGVVLLAAGSSQRLGQSKQLLAIEHETAVHRAARLALSTHPLDAVVVLGHAASQIATALADLPIRPVVAANWMQGMGASAHAGVRALAQSCQGVLLLLCDQPALDAAHLMALTGRWQRDPGRAVASGYAGVIGVPAVIPRDWLTASALGGDRGARALLRDCQTRVDVVVNELLSVDIDLPSDLLLPVEACWGHF